MFIILFASCNRYPNPIITQVQLVIFFDDYSSILLCGHRSSESFGQSIYSTSMQKQGEKMPRYFQSNMIIDHLIIRDASSMSWNRIIKWPLIYTFMAFKMDISSSEMSITGIH